MAPSKTKTNKSRRNERPAELSEFQNLGPEDRRRVAQRKIHNALYDAQVKAKPIRKRPRRLEYPTVPHEELSKAVIRVLHMAARNAQERAAPVRDQDHLRNDEYSFLKGLVTQTDKLYQQFEENQSEEKVWADMVRPLADLLIARLPSQKWEDTRNELINFLLVEVPSRSNLQVQQIQKAVKRKVRALRLIDIRDQGGPVQAAKNLIAKIAGVAPRTVHDWYREADDLFDPPPAFVDATILEYVLALLDVPDDTRKQVVELVFPSSPW